MILHVSIGWIKVPRADGRLTVSMCDASCSENGAQIPKEKSILLMDITEQGMGFLVGVGLNVGNRHLLVRSTQLNRTKKLPSVPKLRRQVFQDGYIVHS